MKKILLTLILGFNILYSLSQNCHIAFTPLVIPSSTGGDNTHVDNYLYNRLRSLILNNGGIAIENNQFAIAMSYDILNKQVLSGIPIKIVYNLNISMFIVDTNNKKIYSSFNTEVKGIGDSETKALINCFKGIGLANNNIKQFIEKGEKGIIDYYDNNYQKIIAKATSDAALKNFDTAIYALLCIPECCKGYEAALIHLPVIYKQFVNQHCNENLAQARAAWYASPNSDGASVAGVYLSEIYPDAACYKDAMDLFKEIKRQLGEEWKFMMKQYNDAVAIETQRMEMMREIAIAYAKNQPKETINIFCK